MNVAKHADRLRIRDRQQRFDRGDQVVDPGDEFDSAAATFHNVRWRFPERAV